MRILGLDPGLATTGFAILDLNNGQKKLINCGIIKTSAKLRLAERLIEIQKDLNLILEQYHPEICCIEQLFFSKNVSTGIAVAHARGAILMALETHQVPFREMTPSAMKRALTGDGRADKKSIQKMVQLELGLKEAPRPDDAADAVSLALSLACTLR